MQNDAHDDPVFLGFPVSLPPDELFRLRSHYLPLGKIGGKPSWLNPRKLPQSSELVCKVCQKPMCFLLQVYANSPDDPDHSFHRSIFVFICRNPQCSKANDASNLCAFRCALPRANDFYSFDGPVDADMEGDVPDPHLPADAANICSTCGCHATKKCAKCQEKWYCSRDHQALDWPSHKLKCMVADAKVDEQTNPLNSFVFKEFGVELDQEYVPANLFEGLSDDEDDEGGEDTDDETEEDRQRRVKEFKKFVDSQKGKNADMTKEDLEAAAADQKHDTDFDKFNRLVNLNPDQIIRYKRYGNPLRATARSDLPEEIPPCDVCGAPRRFEMQLMPHLLSCIEVDAIGDSIDFASVYIYTCSATCAIPDQGYAKEFVAKQDFIN